MAISGDTAARPASATTQSHFALTVDLFERNDIEQAVDMLLELLDRADGDTETELNGDETDGDNSEDDFKDHSLPFPGPGCPIADPGGNVEEEISDQSYIEWHTRGRHKLTLGGYEVRGSHPDEDDEDDDPDQCLAQEDIGTDHKARDKMGFGHDSGLGDPEGDFCLAGEDRIVAGSGIGGGGRSDDSGAGDADDAEREGMFDDVPTVPVVSLEPNAFTGERVPLGYSNLLTSFRSGGGIKSADSGRVLRRPVRHGDTKPGVPV